MFGFYITQLLRVHPVSTLSLIDSEGRRTTTRGNKKNHNTSDKSEGKRQLVVWTEGWKQERGVFPPSSELVGSSPPAGKGAQTCLCWVPPSCRGCCVLLDGCEGGECWQSVAGRQASGWTEGCSLLCKVSPRQRKEQLVGKAREFTAAAAATTYTRFLRHAHTRTHTFLTSPCPQTRA